MELLPDGRNFGLTQCAYCGELMHQSEAAVHTYYDGGQPKVEHFCQDKLTIERSCRIKWYLNHLNKAGQ